jgi:hypothetical protein
MATIPALSFTGAQLKFALDALNTETRSVARGGTGASTPASARENLQIFDPITFPSVAACRLRAIDFTAFPVIHVRGYDEPGDSGGGYYKYSASAPSHPGKFQDSDDTWWELIVDSATPEMFGSAGNGETSDTTPIRNAISYCVSKNVPLFCVSPNGYAIDDQIRINNADVWLIGHGGRNRPTFHALTTTAQIAVGRASHVRLTNVSFSGLHPTTGIKTATNAFVTLPRGGEDTGITGANSFTLDRCIGANTRGSVLVIGRDSTEVRINGCLFTGAGRIDEDGSGAGRFPDGQPPIIDWRGNGSITNTAMSGGAGYAIEISAGPADAFGVYEEVLLRAVNVRAQSCFLGLLKIRDWEGNGTRADAVTAGEIATGLVSCVWSGGYLENPGTVQDATTSGGSTVTQGSGDDVVTILAEGKVNFVIDSPAKVQNRRALSMLKLRSGAVGKVDMRATEVLSQQLGNTSNVRQLIDLDEESSLHWPGFPELAGTRTLLSGEGDGQSSTTKGAAYGRTQLASIPTTIGLKGLHLPSYTPLARIVDGTGTSMIIDLPGFDATTHTAIAGSGTGSELPVPVFTDELGPALRVTGRTSAPSSTNILHAVPLKQEWQHIPLLVEVDAVFTQTEATWTPITAILQIFDAEAIKNNDSAPLTYRDTDVEADNNTVTHPTNDKIFPVFLRTPQFTVPAPGGLNARSPVYKFRALIIPQLTSGNIAVRFRPRSSSSDAPYQCDYLIRVYPASDVRPTLAPFDYPPLLVNFQPLTGAQIAALTPQAGWVRVWDGTGTAPDGGANGEGVYRRNTANTDWVFVG